jgi:hypothetical protein
MFEGEKTRIFWWGLIFSVISVCVLFHIFWYTLAVSTGLDLVHLGPEIFGSIVFLLVGLYMMKNGTKKKAGYKMTKNERPNGVIIIAVLTLFTAIVLGLSAYVVFVFQGVGGFGSGGLDIGYVLSAVLPLLALALYAFCLSSTMFSSNSKYIWYSSFIFWVAVCILFFPLTSSIWASYSTGEYAGFQNLAGWQMEQLEATLIPYIYAIGCSLYFLLSKNVRGYFGISS